jgi:hypothetical protein
MSLKAAVEGRSKLVQTGLGIGALAGAVALAPAALVAAATVAWCWWLGWPATRLRNVVVVVLVVELVPLLWFGPAVPFTDWWLGVKAIADGRWWYSIGALLPVELLAGLLVGWWWWARLAARHRSGATLLQGEQHRETQRRHRMRSAAWRGRSVYTPLTSRRNGQPAVVLGHQVENERVLPMTFRQRMGARHPWWLEIELDALNRHVAVIGSSGSGKTVLLERLTVGWAEAAWQSYSVGSSARPLVILVNCKGDREAVSDAVHWSEAMLTLGLQPDRVMAWPYEGALDMWQMEPRGLVESLHALAKTSHHYYDTLQRELLHLVIEAPGGPPQSSVEFLERLDPDWLEGAWTGHPAELRHLQTLRDGKGAASAFSSDALVLAELFRSLGESFDAGRSLADVDALTCVVPGTRSPAEASAKASALVQLLVDELNRAPRRVLFVLDEYSAVSSTVNVVNLVERIRSMGGSVVVGAQSWEGLAPDDDQRRRLLGAMGGGMFVLQTSMPGKLAEIAGTKRQSEHGVHSLSAHQMGDESSVRMQDAFLLSPQRVRELPVGHTAYVRQGEVTWGAVAQLGRDGDGQPSRAVQAHPDRLLLTSGDRIERRELTAGQDVALQRFGLGGLIP